MAFDSTTRGKLQRLVAACRKLLTDEFDDQFQSLYGIYAKDGRVLDLDTLRSLDSDQRAIGALLRERIAHLQSGLTGSKTPLADAVQRVLREQAFTILNRFAALHMAEERELVLQCVGDGLNSKGFQVFENVASLDLGSQYERYRVFLDCLFDELSLDLGVLFDRFSPFGLLFPREPKLKDFLTLLNDTELKSLWRENETIGWIYQYFNDEAERKKMRGESSAPRNSRELAVRNQFFTPRYVVEFLTDNTLGRVWYEMTRGETVLRDRCRYFVRWPTEIFLKESESAPANTIASGAEENPSREDLLRAPVHIPHRPIKDPRTIRVLDPACGSMHFGLYAFDLFESIYDEAWEIAQGSEETLKSAPSFASFVSYAAQFAEKSAFLREVPRLIVEQNLHGIDIDPRAAQIAGLSLWLRAHRAWQRVGVKPTNRPRITRSNLVCAEPMPGEKELLREFVEGAFPAGDRPAFAFLLEKIFDCLTLAGEAGSLLRIEEEIRTAIAEARALAQRQSSPRQAALFAGTEPLEQEEFNLRGLTTDEQFWEKAEERIYEALKTYAEQAENGGGSQRRLFADDAAQGFAFIDLCRKRYDVVVMNPPFGNPSVASRTYLSAKYPKLWADIYAAFIERGLCLLCPSGRLGAITSRTFLALSSFQVLRDLLLDVAPIQLVAECGLGVLDGATVRAAFFVAEHSSLDISRVAFWDLRRAEDRGAVLHDAIRNESGEQAAYLVSRQTLRKLPGKPFTYWLPERFLRLLSEGPHIDHTRIVSEQTQSLAEVAVGASTTDDPRFVRCHWEVPPTSIGPSQWTRFAHATGFCRFYAPSYAVLNWNGDGKQLLAIVDDAGNIKPRLRCQQHFLSRGLVSPYISERGLGCSYLPEDHIVSNSCRGFFRISGSSEALLAYLNSSFIDLMVWALTPDRKHEAGIIAALPVPINFTSHVECLTEISHRSWQQMIVLRSVDECDPYHWLSLADLPSRLQGAADELVVLQDRLDQVVAGMVSEEAAHLRDISEIAGAPHDLGEWLQSSDDEENQQNIPLDSFLAGSKFSFAVGCVFGRWDIRYATGERVSPELPDPFARLPVCPPGMLQGDDGLPLSPEAGRQLHAAGRYPLDVAWDGVLVDDPEYPLDLERRVHAAFQVLWAEHVDELEHEVCALLGVPGLREWFRRPTGFFADHLSRYSKSRRRAPIYWPLSTASGRYTLWLYYPRLTDQTLYRAVTDFVKPRLDAVTADVIRIQTKAQTGTARERAELEALSDFQAELQDLHDELLRVAQLPWKPNLNDGVLITASPLWKLFRLPKWQKDLKACWEELADGDYDWAHLAYSIWPERVRAKCKTDRSLAIAHGLEDLCEVAAPKPKATKAKRAPNAATTPELPARPAPRAAMVPVRESKVISVEAPAPTPIDDIDRTEVLCVIRRVFSTGGARDRETALRDVAQALGFQRLGTHIREVLNTDFLTAVRRGILENEGGQLKLLVGDVRDYEREFQKENFLSAIGRTWIEREDAIRLFARWLGYARTGPVIEDTARSLINGLLREGRLEKNGDRIRRIS